LARSSSDRPKPIRYDVDTWIVIRADPAIPAAIITRQRTADGREYYRAVSWDLDRDKRLLIGRSATLGGADNLVRYRTRCHPSRVHTTSWIGRSDLRADRKSTQEVEVSGFSG